jgi:hypothetical protein
MWRGAPCRGPICNAFAESHNAFSARAKARQDFIVKGEMWWLSRNESANVCRSDSKTDIQCLLIFC